MVLLIILRSDERIFFTSVFSKTTVIFELMDKEVLKALYYFCAYQERCIEDVKNKLRLLEIDNQNHAMYIEQLKEENYLDELRFAVAYVNGHIRKKWGKEKIKLNLKSKHIPDKFIQQALTEIDEDKYFDQFEQLMEKMKVKYSLKESVNLRQRLFHFAKQKGYENDQITRVLNEIL